MGPGCFDRQLFQKLNNISSRNIVCFIKGSCGGNIPPDGSDNSLVFCSFAGNIIKNKKYRMYNFAFSTVSAILEKNSGIVMNNTDFLCNNC